ncbi:hypothetical protein BKA93DRAFT_748827 [Sparassis latifolia]
MSFSVSFYLAKDSSKKVWGRETFAPSENLVARDSTFFSGHDLDEEIPAACTSIRGHPFMGRGLDSAVVGNEYAEALEACTLLGRGQANLMSFDWNGYVTKPSFFFMKPTNFAEIFMARLPNGRTWTKAPTEDALCSPTLTTGWNTFLRPRGRFWRPCTRRILRPYSHTPHPHLARFYQDYGCVDLYARAEP